MSLPKHLCAAILVCLVSACARAEDPKILLGKWRADKAQFDGISLPISPNFEVTKSHVILKTPDGVELVRHPWKVITGRVNELEIEVQGSLGVSIVFVVESSDRIRYKVPFVPVSVGFTRES